MLLSDVGFSVSLTRQCWGIGSRTTGAPPAAAGGATPARAGGGAGGVNTPAGTTSAEITVVCAVDIDLMASQLVGMLAASKSVAMSITFLLGDPEESPCRPVVAVRSADVTLWRDAGPIGAVLHIAGTRVLRVLRVRAERTRQARPFVLRRNRRGRLRLLAPLL